MSWLSGYLGNQPSAEGGANSRPARSTRATVNYEEVSEEEDLEEGLVFDSPLTSPKRPHQSASVSPRVLLQPDPPTTEDLLAEVSKSLVELPEEEVIVEDHVFGLPVSGEVGVENEVIMPDAAPVIFEDENGADDAGALREACQSLTKLEWDNNDVKWFFNRAETRMKMAGVKKNYTKFQILSEIIPKLVQDEVKPLLQMGEDEFPNHDGYKQLKKEIFRIFGPKPEEAAARALNRVLVGQPSSLARALTSDLCKRQLDCPCCPSTIAYLWKRQLSSAVRAGIAHAEFNKQNFNNVVQLADKIHSDTNGASVASMAIASVKGQNMDETLPAIPYPAPEVAAVGRGRGGRGRGRGGRGRGGRGGAQPSGGAQPQAQPRHKGTKHPDLPQGEWKGCSMHFKWGRGSFFCAEPSTCPWRDIFTPKPAK